MNQSKNHPEVLALWIAAPPPSTNSLFTSYDKSRRRKTKVYRVWQRTAAQELVAQKGKIESGPYSAIISVSSKLAGDLDNYAKATIDIVVATRKIPDDRNICCLHMVWGDHDGVKMWFISELEKRVTSISSAALLSIMEFNFESRESKR